MKDLALPAATGLAIAAIYWAWRNQDAPGQVLPGQNDGGLSFDFQVPDFGLFVGDTNTDQQTQTDFSGQETYSAADVAGIPIEGDNQLPTILESAATSLDPFQYMTTSTNSQADNANTRAFLDMIAFSEGTSGPEGYRVMFGYPRFPDRLITSFVDHPRRYFDFQVGGKTYKTSAAGRYQFLASTWDDLKRKLGLSDFSPASQDAAAIELIRQRGALIDVRAGRIATAITKCSKTWASLPGAGYGQPEQKIATLLNQYAAAGGQTLEA